MFHEGRFSQQLRCFTEAFFFVSVTFLNTRGIHSLPFRQETDAGESEPRVQSSAEVYYAEKARPRKASAVLRNENPRRSSREKAGYRLPTSSIRKMSGSRFPVSISRACSSAICLCSTREDGGRGGGIQPEKTEGKKKKKKASNRQGDRQKEMVKN